MSKKWIYFLFKCPFLKRHLVSRRVVSETSFIKMFVWIDFCPKISSPLFEGTKEIQTTSSAGQKQINLNGFGNQKTLK